MLYNITYFVICDIYVVYVIHVIYVAYVIQSTGQDNAMKTEKIYVI